MKLTKKQWTIIGIVIGIIAIWYFFLRNKGNQNKESGYLDNPYGLGCLEGKPCTCVATPQVGVFNCTYSSGGSDCCIGSVARRVGSKTKVKSQS